LINLRRGEADRGALADPRGHRPHRARPRLAAPVPGDIRIERDGFTFYFPIVTGLIVSVVISLVLWFFRK